jgi:hypothetical protein
MSRRLSTNRLANWLEPRLYRLLRIPVKPELVERDEDGYLRISPTPDLLRTWYLALPWYGLAANRFILALHRTGRRDWGVRRQIRSHLTLPVHSWRGRRALAQARVLVYTSPYVHDPKREHEIEGYFDLPGGLHYGLTIHSLRSGTDAARLEWETGSIHRLETYPWTDDVVVPTRSLEPDQVEEVLRRWYVESFRWKWGHWSNREGRLPEFRVALTWRSAE